MPLMMAAALIQYLSRLTCSFHTALMFLLYTFTPPSEQHHETFTDDILDILPVP